MKTHEASTVLLLASFLVACGGGEPRWAGTISDSAGVTIVSNTDVGIWSPGEAWTLEEELRIGALEGAPEYQFGLVGSIAVDSKGSIYVLDSQAQHIQVYSPDGVYERTVGTRGGGPGELQAGMALLIGPGDTLLVPDGQNLRFTRYAPDGSSAGSTKMVIEEGRPMGFRATASGVIAEQIRPLMLPNQPAIEDAEDAIVLLANDGTVTDTLTTFPSGETIGASSATLFAPEPVWDLTDELQLVFGVNDDYRIGLYAGGRPERIFTKPFDRIPVGDADKEAVRSELRRRMTQYGASAELIERNLSRFHFADYFPAFNVVVAGPMGTIWVQRILPISQLGEGWLASFGSIEDIGAPDWDVFDAQGRFLGVVQMPQGFTPRLFRGDKIYGVWRDELDVQYVLRLRIVGDLGPGAT
jgi:hypothetical protein